MKTYKAVKGKGFAWGVGILVFITVIMAVPLTFSLRAGENAPGFPAVIGIIFLMVAAMSVYFTWAAKNMSYTLTERELVIRWAFNKKVIPLENIRGMKRSVGTSSVKVVGASWPGFHLGSFTDPLGHGIVNMYGTRLWGDIILLKTRWETIGITPEDPDGFSHDLTGQIPGLGEDGFGEAAEKSSFSPWKDKVFVSVVALTALIFAGTGIYLAKTIPGLPDRVPMHFNIKGQVDRYGSPNEMWTPLGIGVMVDVLMLAMTTFIARNNKTSAYMMAFVGLFIAIIFSMITLMMTMSA